MRSRPWLRPVGVLAVAALTLTWVYRFDPSTGGYFPACVFKGATGYYCPGCGLTRSLHHLLHGRVSSAFKYNPLFVLLLPLIGYGLVHFAFPPRSAARTSRGRSRWAWALLVVVLAYWVLRNIPVRPFSYLAPSDV